MMMKQGGMFTMYLSLALGYILCILAKKQEGVLKTLGYALGIAILVITLISGIISSCYFYSKGRCPIAKMCCMGMMDKDMRGCPMMKK